MSIALDGRSLTLDQLIAIARRFEPVTLAPEARARVEASRRVVDDSILRGDVAYGVNTGFGNFAEVAIPPESLALLQVNLLRSHAAGVGEPLPVAAVRAMTALRANVLAKGYSGVRPATIDLVVALLNSRVHAVVPSRGSVGASGDLAPLAHLALLLIGEGEAWHESAREPGAAALQRAGLVPITLAPKEGLALINGTQASAAILGLAVADAAQLARAADIVAAMSIDALRGSTRPFDARIHAARGMRGQQTSAANLRLLLDASDINESHANCGRVQDAYSMRCAPQVHGAARDAFAYAHEVFAAEANAGTDNPMVFADEGDIVSGGNFHGAPVAIAADLLSIALVPLATISERRTERLLNPALSGLPAFLTPQGGLQSGLMMAQVTAAALASEMKTLAHPAGIDTIPTSANKEDHVSMSMAAALKASRAIELAQHVLAIELLCACQAIDQLSPLTSSEPLMRAHACVRSRVAVLEADRSTTRDVAAIVDLIASGDLERACARNVN
jgi:histidine ammonia-lyase